MIYQPSPYDRVPYNIKISGNQEADIKQILLEEYKILLEVVKKYPAILEEFKAAKEGITKE
jgi:hypothetical protein